MVGIVRRFHVLDRIKKFGTINLIIVCTICAIGLGATVLAMYSAEVRSRTDAANAAEERADEIVRTLDRRLNTYLEALYGYRAYFGSSEAVTRNDFHNFFSRLDIAHRYVGFNSIVFIRKIPAAELDTTTTQIRNDSSLILPGELNFTVTPPGSRDTFYPITYAEPVIRNSYAYGFDVGIYPSRMDALSKSEKTQKPVATESIRLVNAVHPSANRGFLIVLPVSLSNDPSTTYGFVTISFEYQALFNELLKGEPAAIFVQDGRGATVYSRGGKDTTWAPSAHTLNVYGQKWTLHFPVAASNASAVSSRLQPWLILIGGTFMTFLALFATISFIRSRQAGYQLAEIMAKNLQTSERRYELMVNSIKDYAIILLDSDGRIRSWNRGAKNISGYSSKEAIGRHISMLYAEADAHVPSMLMRRASRSSNVKYYGWRLRKNGKQFWAGVTVNALRSRGKITGYISVLQDLSVQKQNETERDSFIAIATHELKTPITSMKTYAQVLERRFRREGHVESADLLARVDKQADRLTALVNDLLDVSKIENGKLEYVYSEFSLRELIDKVADDMARTTNIHTIIVKGRSKARVYADQSRIEQVLSNLLHNAIKYSPSGGQVTIGIKRASGFVNVSIADTGIGISKPDQSKVFNRFYRTKTGRGFVGFGLGLFLSAEIVAHHGGSIKVESISGEGSTFYFTLPVTKGSA